MAELAAGTRLGPYEVIEQIGAGGMGVVYRATDSRLRRSVAIKVLPPGTANDADRRARFEREARLVATLSHPNIVGVFDTGDHDGELFVVMELLDGETLRDRLAQGRQPLRKTLDIAAQVARGLAAAHEKGLVHRDLKPANIFLLRDGQVKILDFGLARHAELLPAQETRTADPLTGPGAVMGTAGYMAPEQVKGEPADARADLFAFGAVLYEMLSGHRAFHRDTAAETSTAILREDPPDLTTIRPDLSPSLERIVRHCLEKNPVERFQTARDVAFALDALSGSGSAASSAIAVAGRSRRLWPAAAIVVVALAGIASGVVGTAWLTSPQEPVTFVRKTFDDASISNARFMPDGTTIVYSASTGGGAPSLYELRDSASQPRQFGAPGAALFAVSSTGELAVMTEIGHRAGVWVDVGTLARMGLDGAPRAVATDVSSADWSPDAKEFAVVHHTGGLARLEYPIGHELYQSAGYISDIRVSPDGRRVAFMDHRTGNDNRGWVRVVDTTGAVTTLAGEFAAQRGLTWSRDGHRLLFSALDGQEDRPSIRQIPAAHVGASASIAASAPQGLTVFDTSPSGVVLAASEEDQREVGVKLRGVEALKNLTWLEGSWGSSISQDGQLLLFSHGHGGPNYMTALRRTDGSPIVNLGDGSAMGISPDGTWAMAVLLAAKPAQLMAYPTGAGTATLLPPGAIDDYDPESLLWLPDSRTFLFRGSELNQPMRTYLQSLNGGEPRAVLPANIHAALVTIDGRQVLAAGPGQPWKLYPLQGESRGIDVRGLEVGDHPVGWSSDGRAIFTSNNAVPARLERVDLATGVRSLVRDVYPGRHGAQNVFLRGVTENGEQFAYEIPIHTSTLHLVKGVRAVGMQTR